MADLSKFSDEELAAMLQEKEATPKDYGINNPEDPNYREPGVESVLSPIDFLVGAGLGGISGVGQLGKLGFRQLMGMLGKRGAANAAAQNLWAHRQALDVANKMRQLGGTETAAEMLPELIAVGREAAPVAMNAGKSLSPWLMGAGGAAVGAAGKDVFSWLKETLGLSSDK